MALSRLTMVRKGRVFLWLNFVAVAMFGIIYYVLQYVDKDMFATNKAVCEEEGDKLMYSIADCMHFSLVTQTTIGYGGTIPYSTLCLFVNSLQLISIMVITAITFGQ